MKRNFLSMAMMVISLLVFSGLSWSACPQDPIDLGICDTLYVEPWAQTDTCFQGICINQPGKQFPCFLFVSFFVTHDSNSFYWPGGGRWAQDSISTFVVPLNFWHDNVAGKVIFPTTQNLNNTKMDPSHALFPKSVFRHLVVDGDTIYNKLAQMVGDPDYLSAWTVGRDLDTLSGPTDSGHVHMSLIPASPECRRWWEGRKELLATYTFKVTDSMHVCFDSTFWPPANNLSFTRYDAVNYFPRHNLPLSFWVGPARIQLISPNGGEVWLAGETHNITWFSENFTGPNVKLEFSTNAGASWTPIINSTPNDGVHPWTIPNNPSTQCRVRVSDAADGVPSDISDSNFTITSPSITVIAPNGGEKWCAGSTQLITWTGVQVTNVKIEYSTTGAPPWQTIIASTPNDGEYSWDIPPDLSTSTTCKVKISDLDGEPFDISDGNFTITGKSVRVVSPNGGETWVVDSTYNITWTDSCVENVSIEYSTNGGTSWNTIISSTPSDGSHPWKIPNAPSSSCRVRICEADGAPCDTSNANFFIVHPDFGIQVNPQTLAVTRGDSGEYRVTLASLYGFSGVCTLTVAGLPGGTTGRFDPPKIDFGVVDIDTSILTVTIADTTTPDTFTLTVTASEKAKQIQHSQNVTLIVPSPDFAMTVLPETLEIHPTATDSFQINLTSLYGFASPCSLSVAGLSAVGTWEFHPDTLTPPGTSFLVITDTTFKSQVYPVTITATEMTKGKGVLVQHNKVVYLKVLPPYTFMVEAFPDTQWVFQGNDTTYKVWLIVNVPTDSPCTLSVFHLPPGATGEFNDSVINDPYADTVNLTIATTNATPEDEYHIFIEARLLQYRDTTEVILVVQSQSDVDEGNDQPNAPDKFALFQNQPNPFNPETKISYYLPQACEVKLTIYNILGRKVKTLIEGYQNAGAKTLVWDGKDDQGEQLSSGIYFYRLQAGTFNQTRKMNLIK